MAYVREQHMAQISQQEDFQPGAQDSYSTTKTTRVRKIATLSPRAPMGTALHQLLEDIASLHEGQDALVQRQSILLERRRVLLQEQCHLPQEEARLRQRIHRLEEGMDRLEKGMDYLEHRIEALSQEAHGLRDEIIRLQVFPILYFAFVSSN